VRARITRRELARRANTRTLGRLDALLAEAATERGERHAE
jgi:hypothetical protein